MSTTEPHRDPCFDSRPAGLHHDAAKVPGLDTEGSVPGGRCALSVNIYSGGVQISSQKGQKFAEFYSTCPKIERMCVLDFQRNGIYIYIYIYTVTQ